MMRSIILLTVALTLAAEPAHAHFVVAAAASLWAGATALASTALGSFLLRMAVGVGLNALQRARAKKKRSQGAGLTRESTTTGETTPQSFIIGRYASGGNAVCPAMSYGSWNGAPNGILTYVIDLGDKPITSLDEIYLGGELIEFGGDQHADGLGEAATGRFAGNVFYRFHDGSQTEADAFLLDKYADYPERPWTTDMVGAGVPYAVVNMGYDRSLYSGWPALRFVAKGIPLYDPRKDSSVGGSGPQRWEDPATWEFSENAIVAGYNILRGIRLSGGSFWGGGAGFEDLPLSVWAAAMTAADPVSEGGTAPIPQGFRVGFEVTTDEEPFDVFDRFMQAAGAEYVEVGGVWLVRVGPPALPVYFFTDDDVIRTQERDLDPFPDIKQTYNAVHGSYPSPADGWEIKDAPGVYDPEFEAADAGNRLVSDLAFEAVPFLRQVRYLMRAWQKDARRFLQHTLTLPPDALRVNPLDSVSWTSTRHGYAAKIFEVDKVVVNGANLTVALALRERDAGDYVPEPADDAEDPAPSSRVVPPPVITVPGFSVEAVTVQNESGSRQRSGIRIRWSQSATAFRGLRWKIRRAGADGQVLRGSTLDLSDGYEDVFEGVIQGQRYYVSARIVTDLISAWSNEEEVLVTPGGFSPDDLGSEIWERLDEQAQNSVTSLFGSIDFALDHLAQIDLLGRVNAVLEDARIDGVVEAQRTELKTQIDNVSANLSTNYHTAVSVNSALSAIETSLSARISNVSASLSTNYYTIAQVNSAISAMQTSLSAQIGSVSANLNSNYYTSAQVNSAISAVTNSVTTQVNSLSTTVDQVQSSVNGVMGTWAVRVNNNGVISSFGLMSEVVNGTASSAFTIAADKFVIASTTGAAATSPFTIVGGVTYIKNALIKDAAIGTAKIANLAVDTLKIAGQAVETGKIANNAATAFRKATGGGGNKQIKITNNTGVTIDLLVMAFFTSKDTATMPTAGCRIYAATASGGTNGLLASMIETGPDTSPGQNTISLTGTVTGAVSIANGVTRYIRAVGAGDNVSQVDLIVFQRQK